MRVRIEGENIILRSVDSSDIDTILLWENSTNEPLYGVFDEQYTREDVAKFVENQQLYSFAETEQMRLMICSHGGDRLGAIDLSEYDGEKADVSILIFDSCNRRKGFAKSALHLVVAYAKTLDITTIFATIHPQNLPSVNLFKKAGFESVGAMRYAKSLL